MVDKYRVKGIHYLGHFLMIKGNLKFILEVKSLKASDPQKWVLFRDGFEHF